MKMNQEIKSKCKELEFSGSVRIIRDGIAVYDDAFGFSDRSNRLENNARTRFAIASGTKTFTAMGIGLLIDRGKLELETPLNKCLKEPFPLIDSGVTIDHLLTHSSGIYDYFDEELIDDFDNFELSIPNHKLYGPGDYVPMLHGAMKFSPGERFCYSNSGYILLALVIEELSGMDYSAFIEKEVFHRAGMKSSGYFRMDQLPGNTAFGYIDEETGWKTNIFSVPIKGGGDGGAFTTTADLELFWKALLDGRIISKGLSEKFTEARIQVSPESEGAFYGRGLWIRENGPEKKMIMEGCDAGVSCLSFCYSAKDMYSVLSNTTSGAYAVSKAIQENWG